VDARLRREPELARLIAEWEHRLAPLALGLPPVHPPAQVWWSIARSVGREGDGLPAGRWRSWLWRGWALGASLVAAGLAALLVLQSPLPFATTSQPRLIAVLLDPQAKPAWLVSATPEADRLRARPLAPPPDDKHVEELWALPPGAPPVSLGVLQAGAVTARTLPPDKVGLLAPGQGVAISLEPPGGSPTGRPTGPVVYTGVLVGDV
jgi:anti-sigma-K factor RskA